MSLPLLSLERFASLGESTASLNNLNSFSALLLFFFFFPQTAYQLLCKMVTIIRNSAAHLFSMIPSFLNYPLGGAPLLGKDVVHLKHRPIF